MAKKATGSIGLSKARLRREAASILEDRGFRIAERTGQGIRPWARVIATSVEGARMEVAVRTGSERSIGFSRLKSGAWRTLDNVQMVLAVVPGEEDATRVEVLAFESELLKRWYDKALKVFDKAGRSPELDVPIFIPLDGRSRKNLGHNIFGMKKDAIWSTYIDAQRLMNRHLSEDADSFIARVKREFAERNEVDVSKVSVEFRILA